MPEAGADVDAQAGVSPRTGPYPPKGLILGIYGAFVRDLGGWIAVSHLITLLADLGVDQQAVRAATSRLRRRGLLATERRNGLAGYGLTETGLDVLAEGDQRIYVTSAPASLADGWTLVVFSVPESRRDRRHVLRSRLAWLGFGNLAPGVWIAPARLRPELENTLGRLGLTGYVDVFEAHYHGFEAVRALVERSWDLPALAAQYEQFLADQRPVLRRWENDGVRRTGREGFADYLLALTQWRRLPFLDPGLPPEVLPPGWPGHAASAVFHALRTRIEPAARHWVRSVVDQ
ncbi:MAG: hypothetical protein GEV03_22815 [Streptosporangiales bacterium]|nr:hypothetical protein [Streptosporangiales bacterium]